MRSFVFVAASGLLASTSLAQFTPLTGPTISEDLFGNIVQYGSPQGDIYTVVPGIGGAGGFAVSGAFVDSFFDGFDEKIGNDALGLSITSFESEFDNGGGNFDIQFGFFGAGGGDVWPAGFSVGGLPADQGGIFVGTNAGGNPLDFLNPAFLNSATINLLDAGGVSLSGGPVDVLGIMPTNMDGSWTGDMGVVFGQGSAGAGVNRVVVDINVDVIPAPGAAGLLVLASGIVGVRRRRR